MTYDVGNPASYCSECVKLKAEVEQCHAKAICCCGDYMKQHNAGHGHTAVSMYDNALEDAVANSAALRGALKEVMTWIASWDVPFRYDAEWADEVDPRIRQALATDAGKRVMAVVDAVRKETAAEVEVARRERVHADAVAVMRSTDTLFALGDEVRDAISLRDAAKMKRRAALKIFDGGLHD